MLEYRPREYQDLVRKLIDEKHQISTVNGLPDTFYNSINGVEVLSNFHSVYKGFLNNFPHSYFLEKEQLLLTFKILLQQELDRYWYTGFKTYKTDLEIINDNSLVNFCNSTTLFLFLPTTNSNKKVCSIKRLWLKLFNSPLKYCHGMSLPYAPKPMFNFLNQICIDLNFRIVVTNTIRSHEYQGGLIKKGHITPLESSHLYGYSVDIERYWFQKYSPCKYDKIRSLFKEMEAEGRINFVEYGRIWHVCLSPSYIFEYID